MTSAPSSLTIRLNTIGYLPSSTKKATINATAVEFAIRDMRIGDEVFRGRLSPLKPESANEEGLCLADFSDLHREGRYRLEVLGNNAAKPSCEFQVSKSVYNWPFYCVMRGMYLWRCGTEVSGEFQGRRYAHAACHTVDGYLDYVGGPAGAGKDASGGWHDAGDYNKYTVNAAFTLGMMLHAWEHFRDRIAPIKLNIPESGNSVPDFLDECRWETDWLLKMQADDGRVYHKLSTLKFGGFILPEKETDRRYFSPWGSAATADFAAIMAQAARVFRGIDDRFSGRCLAAAKKSYEFLERNPADHRPDLSAFSTGPYDEPDPDDRVWAAAELWQTTGEAGYLHDFERRIVATGVGSDANATTIDADWDWGNLRDLGTFTYLLSERSGRDAVLVGRIRRDAIGSADAMVEAAKQHPYGRPFGSKYYWGCNGTVARQAMNLEVAYEITHDERYRATILDALNHLFGRNPFGRSYVTGLGRNPPMFPHDRRSAGDQVDLPWPGYLIGGPWPKPTDWHDVQENYQTNEIAINWNGALIYALAGFVEPQSFEESIKSAQEVASTGHSSK